MVNPKLGDVSTPTHNLHQRVQLLEFHLVCDYFNEQGVNNNSMVQKQLIKNRLWIDQRFVHIPSVHNQSVNKISTAIVPTIRTSTAHQAYDNAVVIALP